MDMAQKFRRFLRTYRRSDGSAWSGADIERATRGYVSRFYVSRLRRGLIDDPGFKKIVAISRAMGIPIEAWLDDHPDPQPFSGSPARLRKARPVRVRSGTGGRWREPGGATARPLSHVRRAGGANSWCANQKARPGHDATRR